jgi:hypothetical protein
MATCGCYIDTLYLEADPAITQTVIVFCPLHAAAPDLLAACERALDALYSLYPQLEYYTDKELDLGDEHWIAEVILELRSAIAAASPNRVPKGAHKATPPTSYGESLT